MSVDKKNWEPLSVSDEVGKVIDRNVTGPEWFGFVPENGSDDARAKHLDEALPSDVNRLAAILVNNRVADPAGVVAYGRDDGKNYVPPRAGEPPYDRTLIARMLSAHSYWPYLTTRLFWTLVLTGGSTVLFYVLSWYGGDRGWFGGMLALGTSVLFVLGWLLIRLVREQTNSRGGGFFRHKGSLAPIQAVSTATAFLEEHLDAFKDEVEEYQTECISKSDQLPRIDPDDKRKKADYCDNANAMARSMVTWAVARRAAQYLWFQPINVQDKYEMSGMTKTRIAAWNTTYMTIRLIAVAVFIGICVILPHYMIKSNGGLAETFWEVERNFYVWPLAQAVFAAAMTLWLGGNDKRTYLKDRNRVTLALDDFWRRGTVRTPDQISALDVPASATYNDWFRPYAELMLAQEIPPNVADFDAAFQEVIAGWEVKRIWHDDLVATDPTPQLMRRYLKFLETVGARSVVHNRSMPARSPEAPIPSPSGIGSDARPRTRALATLTRREIWHP